MKLIDWANRTEQEKQWFRGTAFYLFGVAMGFYGCWQLVSEGLIKP